MCKEYSDSAHFIMIYLYLYTFFKMIDHKGEKKQINTVYNYLNNKCTYLKCIIRNISCKKHIINITNSWHLLHNILFQHYD